MTIQQPVSPLDRIKNLEPLDPKRVEAFLKHHQDVTIPKIIEGQKRQAVAAAQMRWKLIF